MYDSDQFVDGNLQLTE